MSRYDFGGVVFDDYVPAPSGAPGEEEYLEDFLNSVGGGEEILFEHMPVDSSGEVMEDPQSYPTYPFLELGNSSINDNALIPGTPMQPPSPCLELGNSSTNMNASTSGALIHSLSTFLELGNDLSLGAPKQPPSSFLEPGNSSINPNASTPGTPVQPPPPIASVSSPCSPPNSSTALEAENLPYADVEVIKPPSTLEPLTRHNWIAEADSMLPHDILKRAPRKRGEGRYSSSGQMYKPCTREEFMEQVNEEINAGKYKVTAKRPRRQRQLHDLEGAVTDPVIVTLQAQAELYGEHFNGAANYIDWIHDLAITDSPQTSIVVQTQEHHSFDAGLI
ncbi:hypothetical protein M758_5G113400 [Ceratodon purpureus]|nr:hypothetical protein M758_5G113400 [Ceratodon purpureus]